MNSQNNKTIIINGKELALETENRVVERLKTINATPKLAVILVGEDKASQIYISSKKKKAKSLSIDSFDICLDKSISQDQLIDEIKKLNEDRSVHAILLQLPLPKHLNSFEAIKSIHPLKDVDGFHPENVGLLNVGQPRFVPCTPTGCIKLIKSAVKTLNAEDAVSKEEKIDLSGMNAVIIGRSNVVGWPLSKLLLNENCTVITAHSRTKNLSEFTEKADIIVVAAGCPDLLKSDMITKGKPIIIDVGINRCISESGENRLKGDVNFDDLYGKVKAITPVPGGVGPMTIACLMENVLKAWELSIK